MNHLQYLALLMVVVLTITSLKKSKSRKRDPIWMNFKLDTIIGNNTATISWASIVLIIVLVMISGAGPGKAKIKEKRSENEMASYRSVGYYFGNRFSLKAKENSKILVIDSVENKTARKYHNSFIAGLKSGIYRHIDNVSEGYIGLEKNESNDETSIDANLIVSADKFDELVEKHADCNIIISLIGIPKDYSGSETWLNVKDKGLLFGIMTNNIYELGGLIFENEISMCIVPKTRFSYDDDVDFSNPEQAFASRYVEINSQNVSEMLKLHRPLFRSASSL